jgi:hypothetical protein
MADTDSEPGGEALTDRVEQLEDGQNRILSKLDELLGGGRKDQPEPDGGTRPASIEEQVRAELDRKEKESKAAAAKDADKAERKTMREQMAAMAAKLAEAKPQQPQPRRERAMWGKK